MFLVTVVSCSQIIHILHHVMILRRAQRSFDFWSISEEPLVSKVFVCSVVVERLSGRSWSDIRSVWDPWDRFIDSNLVPQPLGDKLWLCGPSNT